LSKRDSDYAMKHSEEEVMRLEIQATVLSKIVDQEINAMNIKSDMAILDAGCGTGAITRRFAQIVKPAKVAAVDFDPVFIENARKIAAGEGIENISFEVGDIDNLEYQDGMFDLAYCRLVLMHVQDPVKTIEELKRVTKKGGKVAVSDQDDGTIIVHPDMPKLANLWDRYGQWAATEHMDRQIGRKLYSILLQAGLKSVRVFPFPIWITQENTELYRMLVSVPVQIINAKKSELLEKRVFTEEEYDTAIEEFEKKMNEPGGFVMSTMFLAIGEVP
jgi:ubiquinone/menaquinone biosynthesis C-methylase UbiE